MSESNKGTVGSDFQEHLAEDLKDPQMAVEFLMAAIETGDLEYFKVALGKVAKAHGISNILQVTEMARATLYNILKENSNPSLANIQEVLNACGLTIAVTSKDKNQELDLIHSLSPLPRTQMVKKLWEYIKAQGLERDIIEFGERELSALVKKTHRLMRESKSRARSRVLRSTKKSARK